MPWLQWTMISAAVLTMAGCSDANSSTPEPTPVPAVARAQSSLTRITDTSTVCMVNDRYMGSPQIAVEVAGKTYFGCCAMCKQKLESNESARTAVDPVSGKRVDKATAVIARNAAGRVFYFEDEANMRRAVDL